MPVDVLSEVLARLRLTSSLWFRAELGRPFGVAVPAASSAIRFHVAAAGGFWIRTETAERRVGAGDLVLVPHGAAHEITDLRGGAVVPLAEARQAVPTAPDGNWIVPGAGNGPASVVVCGEFRLGEGVAHPFIETLPPLLVLRAGGDADYGWVEHVLAHLEREARRCRTGHGAVVRRLAEIVLIEALRFHGDATEGALAALADPALERALAGIHGDPARDWSVEALARRAGLSRTVFAERFRACMGLSPMRYLANWRMTCARERLLHSTDGVALVAASVGYASESAFYRVFRERFGCSPGSIRRTGSGATSGADPVGALPDERAELPDARAIPH